MEPDKLDRKLGGYPCLRELEVSESFVRLLKANCFMNRIVPDELNRQVSASEVLAATALREMMGDLPESIHASIDPEWRPHIEVIHEERKVSEDAGKTWIETS